MKYTKVEKSIEYPSWCCQKCGEPIGYLGRFWQSFKIFGIYKMFHAHGEKEQEEGRIVQRNISLGGLILCIILMFFI